MCIFAILKIWTIVFFITFMAVFVPQVIEEFEHILEEFEVYLYQLIIMAIITFVFSVLFSFLIS